MKLKLSQLKKIIKEEVTRAMNEMDGAEGPPSLIVDLNKDLKTVVSRRGDLGPRHFINTFKQACDRRSLDCEDMGGGKFHVFNHAKLPEPVFVQQIKDIKNQALLLDTPLSYEYDLDPLAGGFRRESEE